MTTAGPGSQQPRGATTDPYGKPADVYSFGIVLWELGTREEPFKGAADLWVRTRTRSRPAVSPFLQPGVSTRCAPSGYDLPAP